MGKRKVNVKINESTTPSTLEIAIDFAPNTPGFKYDRFLSNSFENIINEVTRYRDTDRRTNMVMAQNWENLRAAVKASHYYDASLGTIYYNDEKQLIIYLSFKSTIAIEKFRKEFPSKFERDLKF